MCRLSLGSFASILFEPSLRAFRSILARPNIDVLTPTDDKVLMRRKQSTVSIEPCSIEGLVQLEHLVAVEVALLVIFSHHFFKLIAETKIHP